jgi:hypothetical protein
MSLTLSDCKIYVLYFVWFSHPPRIRVKYPNCGLAHGKADVTFWPSMLVLLYTFDSAAAWRHSIVQHHLFGLWKPANGVAHYAVDVGEDEKRTMGTWPH